MLLLNKVAVITGVNSGIGHETALKFAENGAKVFGVDISTDKMDELKKNIEALGSEFVGCRCDVRDKSDVKSVLKKAYEHYGKIDIVVNIAGVSCDKPIRYISEDEFSRVMDINVKGVFNFCKYAVPYFKKQKHGVIINTSSVTATFGSGMGCPYPASKAAIQGLSKSLAFELAPWNIRVNTVSPGVVNTEMVASLDPKAKKTFEKTIPMGRMGEPDDISNAMVFLASDMSKYITAADIPVDGGYRPSTVNPVC